MNQASKDQLRRTGSRAAIAGFASAIALLPAQLSHAADRLTKKLTKKQVRAHENRNKQVLKSRFQEHPQLAYQAKPKRLAEAPVGRYGYQGRGRNRGATASRSSSCPFKPAAYWGYNPNLPASDRVSMSYGLAVTCTGGQHLIRAKTDIVDPAGINSEPATGTGINALTVQGGASGPKGTWTQRYHLTMTATPGKVWKSGPPNCAGYRTPVITCKGANLWVT